MSYAQEFQACYALNCGVWTMKVTRKQRNKREANIISRSIKYFKLV